MTKPKRWNGREQQKPKTTGRKKQPPTSDSVVAVKPAPQPLIAPVERIPDEVEVLDEQPTLQNRT